MTRMALVGLAGLVVVATACSTGDGTDLDVRVPAQTAAPTTTAPPVATDLTGSSLDTTDGGDAAEATAVTLPAEPTTADGSVEAVPETGVPGLDDDDAFCAAWARFGGSFQVIAVHAAFGDGSAESTARYELLAAPTVVEAYETMSAIWPEELAIEFDAAADGRFGPLATRIGSAFVALRDAGLDDDGVTELRTAWLDALSERDPLATELAVDVSDEIAALVDDTIGDYLAVVGPWVDDATLVTDVDTPLTDEYLATECPDQGTLAGQEVG